MCSANDADGDVLSYSWSKTGGSISGSGSTVTYTAPSTDGIYTITSTVNDGTGGEDSKTVNIVVVISWITGTVTDIDSNVYQTIIIGDQEWMAEDLKVTHYRNGDAIPYLTSNNDWINTSSGAYCVYDNNEANVSIYGRLYNWYAVDDSRNIPPEGWHVPTDYEWKVLETYLGMNQSIADSTGFRGTDEGGKLKETGTEHWNSPNTGATNSSSFTALPGGYRNYNGNYSNMYYYDSFWSSTEYNNNYAWGRTLGYGESNVSRFRTIKRDGYSIRCVRDQTIFLFNILTIYSVQRNRKF